MYKLISWNRMKSKTINELKKQYHTVGTVLKSNRKSVQKGKPDAPSTQIYDGCFSDLVHGLKSGGVKLVILKLCMQMFGCLPWTTLLQSSTACAVLCWRI